MRGNLTRLDDVSRWWAVVKGLTVPVVEDAALLRAGRRPAAGRSLGRDHLGDVDHGREGGERAQGPALFHPLRLALTGRDSGPELAALLPLIGPDRARARLAGHAG